CTIATETVNTGSGDTALTASPSSPTTLNQTQTYTVNVAPGQGGWTLFAQGPGSGIGLVKIVDPTGATLWDWNNHPARSTTTSVTAKAFAPFVDQGTFVYTYPNTALT